MDKKKKVNTKQITFENLVDSIHHIHKRLERQAGKAVNISLTMRNWLIGLYIDEFEMRGADKAKYGENLLAELANRLTSLAISNSNHRQLYKYLRFYRTYPSILGTLSTQLKQILPTDIITDRKLGTAYPKLQIPAETLIQRLSYSHIELIADIDDDLKRVFYEIECVRGNWSVRELKRQIGSLYYERSSLSKDKKKLAELANIGAEQAEPCLTVQDPYIFEFLGLKSKDVMSESRLEDALLDNLTDFLLEMGQGFCFEARQKRILIGDTYGFIDLVFYHRIIKCHVLIELKVDQFSHQHLGQLNTYVSWYRKNISANGDNPPIGILLCTQKDHTLVEYALAGMDNNLFVSKYQLELPKKEDMERFLESKMKAISV